MINRGFNTELRWLLLWIGLSSLIGYFTGYLLWSLVLALIVYILWIFKALYSLENWVRHARRNQPTAHTFHGIAGEIADDILLMHHRHAKEMQRTQAVVSRVQDMTRAIPDGVILVDQRGNIEWWNKAAEQLLGFRETDTGHKITTYLRHPRFVQYFEGADYSEPLVLTDLRRERQQLEFQMHRFGEGERVVVLRDVTRLFKLEEMRKDFVANVSHELRTPLTVISGYLEALSAADNLPPEWEKPLQQMQQQSRRMTGLIVDLITLSKLEIDTRDTESDHVHLAPLLAAVVDEARSISGDRNHLFAVTSAEKITLRGNERELRSAFSNIIVNAVNYSAPETTIEISCNQDSQGASVQVRDHGIGIDARHLPRLTERFYRVDSSRSVASGGTGLGLAIVKHVLWRHDAELRITSELGKGSCFCCYFPVTRVVEQL